MAKKEEKSKSIHKSETLISKNEHSDSKPKGEGCSNNLMGGLEREMDMCPMMAMMQHRRCAMDEKSTESELQKLRPMQDYELRRIIARDTEVMNTSDRVEREEYLNTVLACAAQYVVGSKKYNLNTEVKDREADLSKLKSAKERAIKALDAYAEAVNEVLQITEMDNIGLTAGVKEKTVYVDMSDRKEYAHVGPTFVKEYFPKCHVRKVPVYLPTEDRFVTLFFLVNSGETAKGIDRIVDDVLFADSPCAEYIFNGEISWREEQLEMSNMFDTLNGAISRIKDAGYTNGDAHIILHAYDDIYYVFKKGVDLGIRF